LRGIGDIDIRPLPSASISSSWRVDWECYRRDST
jgi:hypothetical protein